MNSIFITNSGIDMATGGGNISYNIYLTLKENTDLISVLGSYSSMHIENFNVINPLFYQQPFSPFLYDYFALLNLINEIDSIDLAFFYAAPFSLTAEYLKRKYPKCKIIVDLAPHNIEISMEEHLKLVGQYPYPHFTDKSLWKLYTGHIRIANRVIVHSNSSAEYIRKECNLKEMPVVIPHGCNLPETVAPIPEKFVVGALNVAGIDKGLIYSLLAWKQLNPKLSWFYVAGDGTEQWQNFINQQQIPNVRVFGRVDNVSDFYNKLSVGLFTSVTEGFGICILETMAHGRPVIVAEGAGASEIVEDGKEGFVIPIRDVNAIVEKIRYFRENPDEIKRMGRNAREKAKRYTWDKIREEYRRIINEI